MLKVDTSKKYVQITKLDLDDPHNLKIIRHITSRSFEHYLERYNYEYFVDELNGSYFVEVNDELEAIKIANYVGLSKVTYSDRTTVKSLVVNVAKKAGRPKNTVIDTLTGQKFTPRQYATFMLKNIKKGCLTKTEIIRRKLLGKNDLEKAIEDGHLPATYFKDKCYINRESLADFLSKKQISDEHP